MDLDSKGLDRLRRVADPRRVWIMEADDFMTWLAEHIDQLKLVVMTAAPEAPGASAGPLVDPAGEQRGRE